MDDQSRTRNNPNEHGDQQQQWISHPLEPQTRPITRGSSRRRAPPSQLQPVRSVLESRSRTLSRKHTYDDEDGRNLVEHLLFRALAAKNTGAVKELIEKYWDLLTVDRRSFEGHDMLTGAVLTGDMAIFREVLKFDPDPEKVNQLDITDALLAAVKENQMEMVKELIRIQDSKASEATPFTSPRIAPPPPPPTPTDDDGTFPPILEHGEFTLSITPIMMAAKYGHHELLKYFYDRGDRMPEVHLPSCSCTICKDAARTLRKTEKRLQTLEAMANPTYMIFMAERDPEFEPVYQSFIIGKMIKRCIYEEPGFMERYEVLLEKFQQLPIDLIDLCRSADEVEIFLKQRQGYDHPGIEKHPYPRLAYAIDVDHRKFVTNPNVQFMIQSEFNKDTYAWDRTSTFYGKTPLEWLVIGLIIVLSPLLNIFMWLAMICFRDVGFVKHLFSPVNRCWSKFGSYLYFSAILLYLNSWNRPVGDIDMDIYCFRWAVIVFVVSHACQLGHQFAINPYHFFQRGWNWYDLINLALFAGACGIWFAEYESHFEHISISHTQLDQWNFVIVAECLFAFASTLASLRMIRWIILVPDIGPLQTSMGRMAFNLGTIFIFLVWTIATFSVGTMILYRPYLNVTNAEGHKQPDHITDVVHHVWTFFKVEKIGLQQMYLYPHRTQFNSTTFEEHPATVTNKFIFGICVVFNIVALTFLRGTVIGLFGSSHDTVMMAKNIEWKYLRTQEWLYYIQDMMLAPPLNLIPNAHCIGRMLGRKLTVRGDMEAPEQPLLTPKQLKKEYASLLRNLLQRYFQKLAQEKKDKMNDKKK